MLAHKAKKKVSKEFSTEEKINFLLQPLSYPFHIDKVAVKETHMSLVFLTNGFVYKMKKPVRYDLFDHRSLHSRFINCKEEVKINKQLAKEIYVGLAPLVINKKEQLQLEGNIASKAAIKAGKAILKIYRSSKEVKDIGLKDFPVTKADKTSHKILVDSLCKTGLPILSEEGAHIDYDERKHWKYFWLIDPPDGTKEFLKKNGEFTISIALVDHDTPIGGVIYVPCRELLYYGSAETGVYKISKNKTVPLLSLMHKRPISDLFQKEKPRIVVSRSHLSKETEEFIQRFKNPSVIYRGSSLKFLLLLENEADIYPRLATTMEWDTAAAQALLQASGRGITQMDLKSELHYNKPDLTNPSFIAF